MQRKSGFPVANCSIKMPENVSSASGTGVDEEEPPQRRQQLINFGHSQWGFNNWNWSVTKQDLDFVEHSNGKYTAGVVSFVSVTVKSLDIHRDNIGYATSFAHTKGAAIHSARKCAVTNALRETLLSFGGNVATELMEQLEAHRTETANHTPVIEPVAEPVKHSEPKNSPKQPIRKESTETTNIVRPQVVPPAIKNAVLNPPPVAKAHPMPVNLPPANRPPLAANAVRPPPPPQIVRPNSNVSFLLQPVMPPLYGPRLPPAHLYPNCYEYSGPWHFTYEPYDRHHGNVNLNFNIPPKNLVVNSRSGSVECKNACNIRPLNGPEGEPLHYNPPQNQGCWIKPTIFYDGFWTEQKVKKWVAEQVEKQFPEDASQNLSPPNNGQPDPLTPK